jgi:hypothetical protein
MPRTLRKGLRSLLFVALSSLPACDCGSKAGGNIPCATDQDCPAPLHCDTSAGLCAEPGDGGIYGCDPPLPGCPCSAGAPAINGCVPPGGDPTIVASCEESTSACENGVYGTCVSTPDLSCEGVGVSAGGFDVRPDNSDQVTTGPEGEIVLDPTVQQVNFGFLWIANTGENTVSKLDIETGREVARYASVRDSAALGIPAVPLGAVDGDQNEDNCFNCPSRTAIDFNGDAFVANRAFGRQATVTKFGNEPASCIDRNHNGVIDTSADVNGDGLIDKNSPSEFLAEDDECILWTVPVGNMNGVARALAIDAGGPDGEHGNVWVGLYEEKRLVQISGETGAPIIGAGGQPVSVPLDDGTNNFRPYGAIADGSGNVWATGIYGDQEIIYIAKVNAFTGTLTALYAVPDDNDGCSENYGITMDVHQKVWLGGFRCHDVKRFDPDTLEWIRADRDMEDTTRGVATDLDGNVWVAYTNGRVGKFKIADIEANGDGAQPTMFDLPPLPGGAINSTIGVGIDRNGACWAVSRDDGDAVGTATRIKPNGSMTSFPVGKSPYTYSDFTGFGLLTVVRPTGFWRANIKGCAKRDAKSNWTTLIWSETEPPGTSVSLRVRVADTVAGLAAAPWFGPFQTSPADLEAAGVPDSVFMQIEVQLSTSDVGAGSPAFNSFHVDFQCPGVMPVP